MVSRTKTLVLLAFLTIYVVWGSTYMFIAYVVEEIPPFTATALRYGFATLILGIVCSFSNQYTHLSLRQILNSLFAGVLMIGLGSGVVAWILQYLDSGFTALLISAQPLLIVLIMWVSDKKRPQLQTFAGIFLGMVGIYFLINQDKIITHHNQLIAIITLFGCLCSWGFGSVFISKAIMPRSFMANTSIQFFSGALFTTFLAFGIESPFNVDWAGVSHFAWYSLLYLALFGAVAAFLAFNYLLKRVTPDKVSTATYINPIVALFLGWWFRDELITVQSLAAAFVMLSGVVLINFRLSSINQTLRSLLTSSTKPKDSKPVSDTI